MSTGRHSEAEKEYRILERATGRVLASSRDREEAFRLLNVQQSFGRAWDELDLVDPQGVSLVLRDDERVVDQMVLPPEARPRTFRSLDEARSAGSAYVIVDGDWGGQVYLTAPIAVVLCNQQRLWELARQIDAVLWNEQGDSSLSVTYRSAGPGDGVWGGMGGGALLEDLWVHPEIEQLGWKSQIAAILRGNAEVLPEPHPSIRIEAIARLLKAFDTGDIRVLSALGLTGRLVSGQDQAIVELLGIPPAGDKWHLVPLRRILDQERPGWRR